MLLSRMLKLLSGLSRKREGGKLEMRDDIHSVLPDLPESITKSTPVSDPRRIRIIHDGHIYEEITTSFKSGARLYVWASLERGWTALVWHVIEINVTLLDPTDTRLLEEMDKVSRRRVARAIDERKRSQSATVPSQN